MNNKTTVATPDDDDNEKEKDQMNSEDQILEHDDEAERLLDAAPWASANQDPTLPEIAYTFEVIDITGGISENNGKLFLTMALDIVAPVEHASRMHFERLWIGSDKDPTAKHPQSWDAGASMGATNMWRLMKITGAHTWRDLKGKRFAAHASTSESDDGRKFTNLNSYAKEGDLTPGAPTPPRKFSRKNRRGGGAAPQYQAPSPDAMVPCTSCGKEFPQGEYFAHVTTCTGQIPF